MDPAHDICATASIASARGLDARATPALPPELMLKIVQHLSQSDLRVFAQASRTCYAHTLAAGLCIRRDIFWTTEDGFGNSLQKLDAVLDHAENKPGLNIAITAMAVPWGDDVVAAYRDDMTQLTVSIRRALPNLVRLQVPLADYYAALCTNEAPKLEGLAIYHPGLDVPSLIPWNLFNGCAPRLRKVELSLTDTDSMQPIAAFSSVTHLKLAAGRITRPLRLARLFPALRVLAIDARSAPPTRAIIDLRGLAALRHFALAGDAALLDDASLALLRDIPFFEHEPEHNAGADPVWPTHTGELCAVVERRRIAGPPAISLIPRDPSATVQWRRTILWQSLPDGALPLAEMPLLASSLVSLTIEASLVNALAQSPLMLDKLRELVVDVSHGYLTGRLLDAVARVRCPALERVVLLPAGAVSGLADPVARLRHALGRPTVQVLPAGSAWSLADVAPGNTHPTPNVDSTAVGVPEYYDGCRCPDLFDNARWDEA